MEKFRTAWKGNTVAFFLFLICFFLFNWPLVSIPTDGGGVLMISHLFLLWLFVILGLWFYCRNEADSPPENQREQDNS